MKRTNVMPILLFTLLTCLPPVARGEVLQLATVNGEPVTSDQLSDAFSNRHSGHAKFLGGDHEARKFLDFLINERLFIQEAMNIGLDEEPSAKKLVDNFENEKASSALLVEEIDNKAKPTEDDIKAGWKQLNVVVQGRELAVATQEEAEELRAAILHGGDFDALARTCSLAATRKHGGILLLNWGQREPEFESAVMDMRPGEVSQVLETADVYEVVIVDARHDVERPELAKVRDEIETVLKTRLLQNRKKAYGDELAAKYHVVFEPVPHEPTALIKLLATAPETIVARWDGGSMALKEVFVESEIKQLLDETPLRARREIADKIRATVNEPLVSAEAKARGIAATPEVASKVNRYRELIVQDLLFRDHVWKDVAVSEADVAKYYTDHKGDFVAPEQRHVAQILMAKQPEAQKVREKLLKGADFEEMCKTYSRDFVTARSGGDLGWITPDKVSGAFQEVLTAKVGSVSKPIQSPAGWHIIKILEVKPAQQLSLDDVKEQARQKCVDQKQREAQKFWLDKLKASASIQINDEAIKKFVKENQYIGAPPPQHAPK